MTEYKAEEEEKGLVKHQNCVAAGINVPYQKGWDMKAVFEANRLLSLADLQSLFEKNGWVDYYRGICKNPRF